MRRFNSRSRTACSLAVALLLSGGTVTALALGTPAMAGTLYPSISLNHDNGVKVGETLKVTGKNFPASSTATLYQCNVGLLGASNGVFTSKTCDLKTTVQAPTSSTGTLAASFKVAVKEVDGLDADCLGGHIGSGDFWGWICFGFGPDPYVTSSPTETWLNPQTVKVTGLDIPAPASGSSDVAAECNNTVGSTGAAACGTPVSVTVSSKGKATGKLPVVMGTVGNGTCGTGSADEVCYIVLANVTSGGTVTPIAEEAINFYESSGS